MLFFKSLILGFMIAIPVGPVALLIIQRSLAVGWLAGVASGLGAAIADGLFGFLAAAGLATLVTEVEEYHHFVRPLGSLVLGVMGLYFCFRKPPLVETEEVLSTRYLHHYLWDALSTFILTLTNPATVMAFAALFAGSELIPDDPRRLDYFEIIAGVTIGSLLWWLFLVVLAEPIKSRLSALLEHRIHQIVGLTLIVLAAFSFIGRIGTVIDKIRVLGRMQGL